MGLRRVEQPKTLQSLAYEHIKEAVLAGELESGTRLTEAFLSDKLGISKGPIREALRQLDTEGIVTLVPHRGAFVTEYDPRDINDMYDVRMPLEEIAVREAAPHLTSDHLQALGDIVREMQENLEHKQFRSLEQLNEDFHFCIYERCNNPWMYKVISEFWILTRRTDTSWRYVPGRVEASVREHVAIFAALEGHDGPLAGRRMKAHLEAAKLGAITYTQQARLKKNQLDEEETQS